MSSSIVFDYDKMTDAVSKIRNIAGQYQSAASTFHDGFDEAITSWEGDSKDKLKQLLEGNIMNYLNSIQKAVDGLATLLQNNAKQMQDADKGIADSISL